MTLDPQVSAYLKARSKQAAKTLRKKHGKKYFKELARKRWNKAKE